MIGFRIAMAVAFVGTAAIAQAASPTTAPAQQLAAWVTAAHDNGGRPYVIVDKRAAEVFVFDGGGALQATAPALLGLARGDETVPGIGTRALADIRPEERTTPAGRFAAELGHNTAGHEVLWVDYDAAISLHAVVTGSPGDHRLHRLATPSPLDNRISYGCINVPAKFFDGVILKTFRANGGLVYVLPEEHDFRVVFGITADGSKLASFAQLSK